MHSGQYKVCHLYHFSTLDPDLLTSACFFFSNGIGTKIQMKGFFLNNGNFEETVLPWAHNADEVMLSKILLYRIMSNL